MAREPNRARPSDFPSQYVVMSQHVPCWRHAPLQVDKHVLELMGQYSKFHAAPGRSDKVCMSCKQTRVPTHNSVQERKLFDEKFVRLDTRVLCELTSAADALEMKALVDLTSRALARLIEGKVYSEYTL